MSNLSKYSQGFSMIELLVAIVILAIGLLGVAGIQSIGIRTASVALDHNTATQLAVDIAERMRTNPTAFLNDIYNGTYDEDNKPAEVTCSTVCTPENQAKKDLYQWFLRLEQLNNGSATIARTDSTATIVISWVDVTFGGQSSTASDGTTEVTRTGEEAQSFTLSTRFN